MKKSHLIKFIAPVLIGSACVSLWFLRSSTDDPETPSNPDSFPRISATEFHVPEPEAPLEPQETPQEPPQVESVLVEQLPEAKPLRFTPEMRKWTQGIASGQTVKVTLQDDEREYIFRPVDVTGPTFRFSSGADTEFPAEYQVYEGRELIEGNLGEGRASMAVVHDVVSMALTTDAGDFLIENHPESGELMAMVLGEEGALPHNCSIEDGESVIRAPEGDDGSRDWIPVSMVLADAVAGQPGSATDTWVDHSYFRLGPLYDMSLRDMPVLWGSSKSQTGSSSNLSSRAASYLTFAARVKDSYERQLGLRMQLMELILVPSDSAEDDLGEDLTAWRNWIASNRPQATYDWGHAALWTLVDGSGGGVIGRAFLDRYGSSSLGVSIQERNFDWDVHNHELGHNVGASHSNGGVMNPSLRNNDEDFFRQSENGAYTAAMDIYRHMAFDSSALNKLYGPASLRHPEEAPFARADAIDTPEDTPVSFDPLENDIHTVPFGQENLLRLVEVASVYPSSAGTAEVDGAQITFTPAVGYTGNAWFTYTIQGSVGNEGLGWLHAADVVVTVGGDDSDPTLNPSLVLQDDVIPATLLEPVRFNPLLNDEGRGRLWAGQVDVVRGPTDTTPESFSDPAFQITNVQIVSGTGSVQLETIQVVDASSVSTGFTGYVVYTPGAGEGNQVHLTYDVEDADGNTATANVFINQSFLLSLSGSGLSLVEPEGRVATITVSRPGASGTAMDETVSFAISGDVDLIGPNADLVFTGYSSFHAPTQTGTLVIPAGQSSKDLFFWAKPDALAEGLERATVILTSSERLVTDLSSQITVQVFDTTTLIQESFDGFASSENATWNSWSNPSDDSLDWTINSGSTGSSNTGPNGDNTSGTGQYFYTEASGSGSNKTAHLLSPVIDTRSTPGLQLDFAFHMFGGDMGDLHLDVFSNGSWTNNVMPVLSGQQSSDGDDWKTRQVDLSSYQASDFRLRFRGETGPDFESDMSIDDVLLTYTAAPTAIPLSIRGQPVTQTLDVLQPVYLAVAVESYPQPSFQWKKDGVEIPGATEGFYYVPISIPATAGSYTVEVTQGATVTSSAAVITINGNAEAPVITSQPSNQSADEGDDNIRFTVVATGIPEPTYQWKRNGSSLNGQTSATLDLDNVTPSNNGTYTVDVINPVATVTSDPVTLTVNGRPSVSVFPRLYAVVGTPLDLDGTANDDDSLNISWTQQSGPGTAVFADDSAVDTSVSFDQAGVYTLRLLAQDGVFSISDTVEVQVYEAGITLVELSPIHDGYVRAGGNADTVYNNSDLEVRTPSSEGSNTRNAYLRFDVSSISGTIINADLQLYLRVYRNNTTHRLHAVDSDSWDESSLTFNNAPAQGTVLDSWSPNRVDYYWPSATSQVQSEVDGDGEISLGLSVSSDRQNEYSSSENNSTSQRPKLIVAYQEFTDPLLSVSVSGMANERSADPITFTVTREMFESAAFTMNFELGGTAVPADYTVSGTSSFNPVTGTGSVDFAANELSRDVVITAQSDVLTEGTENVSFQITPGTGYEVSSPNTASGDLLDEQTNYAPTLSLLWPVNAETVASTVSSSHWVEVAGMDDGFAGSSLSYSWTQEGGPGTLSFDSANAAGTRVTVNQAGSYILRCTVSDGSFTESIDVTLKADVSAQISVQDRVIYLPLDESNGNQASDLEVADNENNNGSFTGAPQWSPSGGQLNGALVFDGVDDLLDIADSNQINLSGPYAKRSISLWFRAADLNGRQVLFDEGGSSRGLNLYLEDSTLYAGGWNNNENGWNQTYFSVNGITANTWYHVALVLDATPSGTSLENDVLRGYLNGQLFGSGSGAPLNSHSADTGLGGMNNDSRFHTTSSGETGDGRFFAGSLDEFQLFNRALSQEEIASIYSGTADNTVPVAEAVANNNIEAGASLALDGTASDTETPTPNSLWRQLSGPGTAQFVSASSVDTSVQFDQGGEYVLALIVDDGEMADAALLTITVTTVDANNNDVPDSWEAINEDQANPGTVLLGDGNNYNLRDVYFWGLQAGSPEPLQANMPASTPAGEFSFSFFGVSGVTYRVQRTDALSASTLWTTLPGYESIPGANAPVPVTDASPQDTSIYRVDVILP